MLVSHATIVLGDDDDVLQQDKDGDDDDDNNAHSGNEGSADNEDTTTATSSSSTSSSSSSSSSSSETKKKKKVIKPGDKHERCEEWVKKKQCEKHYMNNSWMKTLCNASCIEYYDTIKQERAMKHKKELKVIGSFFELSAYDYEDNIIDFEHYRHHKVTVIINIDSKCGYKDIHYRSAIDMFGKFRNTGETLSILIFPCNHPHHTEPSDIHAMQEIARTRNIPVTFMKGIDAHDDGHHADLLYQFIRSEIHGKKMEMTRNFSACYIISKDGHITWHSNSKPHEVETYIQNLLLNDEFIIRQDEL